MMTLSTMWRGASQLNEGGHPLIASLMLAHWAHDVGTCDPVRYSSNFVFTFTEAGQRRFLRVADDRERSRSAIAAELDLLVWLSTEGLNVASPIQSRRGTLIETVDTGHGVFHGVVFPVLAGVHLGIDELDQAGFETWGKALGRLHAALRRYHGVSAGDRWSWQDQLALIAAGIPLAETAVQREASDLVASLAAMPAGSAHQGLIHFDFELDNLLWGERGIGIIDFDDCAHHWYAADIAFALRDLFDHGAGIGHPSVRSFLHGYGAQQAIDDMLLSSLPVFSRMARLTAYARIVRSLDLPADANLPPWIEDLQHRFRLMAQRYQASLVS